MAMPTPANAILGGTGHTGMRHGRARLRWRMRLTGAERATSAYSTTISTPVKVTALTKSEKNESAAADTPTTIAPTHGLPYRSLTLVSASLAPMGHARSRL